MIVSTCVGSGPQAQQAVLSMHVRMSSQPGYLPDTYRHSGASQSPKDSQGDLSLDNRAAAETGGCDSPGRKERHLKSSMMGPVGRGQLSHLSLEPVPVAPAQTRALYPEHQGGNCLCSARRHFSKMLQNESAIL